MAPTFDVTSRFERDWQRLSADRQDQFRRAVERFVADVRSGTFRKGLRVKGVQRAPGMFEMTWAPDGRATFEFGQSMRPQQPHVVWRRIGTHDIFVAP